MCAFKRLCPAPFLCQEKAEFIRQRDPEVIVHAFDLSFDVFNQVIIQVYEIPVTRPAFKDFKRVGEEVVGCSQCSFSNRFQFNRCMKYLAETDIQADG